MDDSSIDATFDYHVNACASFGVDVVDVDYVENGVDCSMSENKTALALFQENENRHAHCGARQ